MSNIKSITSVGRHQTFDLEVDHPDHQFYLANGMLTSNSHAVSYAFDSYYAAWLHTHHEKDWLATILQSESDKPDGLAKAIDEIKELGYKFARADVNFSGDEWVFSEEVQAFVPPLGAVKGIGDAAVQEIMEKRPYRSLDDLLFNPDGTWKHSKVNKTCFTSLCKIEALESLSDFTDGRISNHRQLLEVITGDKNYELLKRGRFDTSRTALKRREKTGEAPADHLEQCLLTAEGIEDWTRGEKIKNFVELTSSSPADLIFPENIVSLIKSKGVPSALLVEEGTSAVAWFCIVDAVEKKTKNGKPFGKLTIMDSESRTGSMKVWGKLNIAEVEPYTLWIAEVKRDSWGLSATSWRMRMIDTPHGG